MNTIQQGRINLSAPNLINVCVDQKRDGEVSGRLYHCYREDPIHFQNIVELIREAERLFDEIGFPQASTKSRSFADKVEAAPIRPQRPEKIMTQEKVAQFQGRRGTFVTSVRLRQGATWQGEFYWVEQGRIYRFSNTLDFLKQIDTAVW